MSHPARAAVAPISDPATRPRRATLHLKFPPPSLTPTPPPNRWKCRPCGALVDIDPAVDDQAVVRCPACAARLGRADQFRGEADASAGVRARRA